jgi:hypothetical protein
VRFLIFTDEPSPVSRLQSVCHPAFDQLFRCSREVHADGVMVDRATICRYLIIEYGDRLLSFRSSFFYGEDTLVDNEDLPVFIKRILASFRNRLYIVVTLRETISHGNGGEIPDEPADTNENGRHDGNEVIIPELFDS